jgi:uncharacterized protein YlzI (FlbEa/FlbD family)
MIPLHRLTNRERPFYVNPDLISGVESTPDTVITMTNQAKVVVAETAEEVIDLIQEWRASIYARALGVAPEPELFEPPLAAVLPFVKD